MSNGQLRAEIAKRNAGDRERMVTILDRFARERSLLVPPIREYRARLGLGGDGHEKDLGDRDLDFYQYGAQSFLLVLGMHPVSGEQRELIAGHPIFGESDDAHISDLRRDVSEVLVGGALAIAFLAAQDTRLVDALMHVAFGADTISKVLRGCLGGKPFPTLDDDIFRIPDWLENLYAQSCGLGIQHAMTNFVAAAASNKATSWSTGITMLTPNHGCAGDRVTLHGSGFGATQPSGVEVWFPTRDGRCTRAEIALHDTSPYAQQWSDTRVVAVVPENAGSGCVGFVRFPSAAIPLTASASSLAGEMEQCLGEIAWTAIRMLERMQDVGFVIACPPCLGKGENDFHGGPPQVEQFAIAGGDNVAVEPGTELILEWRVRDATSLRVRRTSADGPFIDVSAPARHPGGITTSPVHQRRNIGRFTGDKPAVATYELAATNSCGTSKRYVRVRLHKTPALKILGVEVVQVIQHFDWTNPSLNNTVRLVAKKRTIARVYVESGIADDFDGGFGPNRQPSVRGTVTVWPDGARGGFRATPAIPFDAASPHFVAKPKQEIQRGTIDDSMNFELPVQELNGIVKIEVRVWVDGHEHEVGTGWSASDASTVVTFHPRRPQVMVRIRVKDDFIRPPTIPPFGNQPAPSEADYFATMRQAMTYLPVAEDGIVVGIPAGFEEISTQALNVDLGVKAARPGMQRLLNLVDWIAGQFADHGEIWAALVPLGSMQFGPYVAGIGTSAGHRRLVCVNGYANTFAHEMGHTFAPPVAAGGRRGIGHAPCGWQISGIDDRLPDKTEDVGVYIGVKVMPSVSKAGSSDLGVRSAGSPDLMSYCDYNWTSITLWDLIFDELD